MKLNLFSNDKLHLLAYIKKERIDLQKLFGRFFFVIDIVDSSRKFQKLFDQRPDFYDIVLVEYTDKKSCTFLQNLHKKNDSVLGALLINENDTETIVKAIRHGIDAVIPVPVRQKTDILAPMLKLISIKNNEKDLEISNFLI